jgi:hypothetical protein
VVVGVSCAHPTEQMAKSPAQPPLAPFGGRLLPHPASSTRTAKRTPYLIRKWYPEELSQIDLSAARPAGASLRRLVATTSAMAAKKASIVASESSPMLAIWM